MVEINLNGANYVKMFVRRFRPGAHSRHFTDAKGCNEFDTEYDPDGHTLQMRVPGSISNPCGHPNMTARVVEIRLKYNES